MEVVPGMGETRDLVSEGSETIEFEKYSYLL